MSATLQAVYDQGFGFGQINPANRFNNMSWNSIGHYQRSLHILGKTPEPIISWLEKDGKTNPGPSHSINSSDIINVWKCFVLFFYLINNSNLSLFLVMLCYIRF